MERITVTLPSAHAAKLARLSEQSSLSVSALVRMAVAALINDPDFSLPAVHTLRTQNGDQEHAEVAS